MTIDYNIFTENIYADWVIDEKLFIDRARNILKFYLSVPEVYEACCLNGFDYDTVSFDFLYCDSKKHMRLTENTVKKIIRQIL